MSRRKKYSDVEKKNRLLAAHVQGMGDIVFIGFQCLNYLCQNFLFIEKNKISDFFEIKCQLCNFIHKYGEETGFYDYKLKNDGNIIESGVFAILHDEYVFEGLQYKYCIICNALKPLDFFDKHSSRKSKHQGECRLCKKTYNSIKNQTRLRDQHREAAQKRRLYVALTGGQKINSSKIYKRYDYKCFKCDTDLISDLNGDTSEPCGGNLDHTLPAMYLWPLTTENATLLCKRHNAEKAEKWPNKFYSPHELQRLVTMTGIDFNVFNSLPFFNPEAIEKLHDSTFVNELLQKYAPYMEEIIKVRNRILKSTGFDFFEISQHLSPTWKNRADDVLNRS